MLSFEKLESRQLLAGIFLDTGSGVLTIAGDEGDNIGQISQINGSTVRATVDSLNQDFNIASVNTVSFLGFDGNDRFTNLTSIQAFLIGHDGDDVLIGGSGFDQINGGNGNDDLYGNAGDDRLIGGNGNDRMYGGAGDDFFLAGNGLNEAYGEDGNDVMLGGIHADLLDGGNGIDQIFGGPGNDQLFSGDGGILGTPGVASADWVLGNDGDDTITAGNGLNVLYGGNGNDTLLGGNEENRLHGQEGNDRLTGGAGIDYLAGHNGDDVIVGLGGNDYIQASNGNDWIDAGDGHDFIFFNGLVGDYQIVGSGSTLTVVDSRVANSIDTIIGAETFRFFDGTLPAVSPVTKVVTIQPIVLSNSDGSNTAEYFGNSTQEAQIMSMIDEIFYQGGIDIQWLTKRSWNNTFANIGNGGTRPGSDLNAIVSQGDAAGVGHNNPLIIDLYFVEIAAGFGNTPENTANGLAFINSNGITVHVGDNLVSFPAGQEVISRVVSHEIAHNLGLDHVSDPLNLMGDGEQLTQSQISTIRNSQFTANI